MRRTAVIGTVLVAMIALAGALPSPPLARATLPPFPAGVYGEEAGGGYTLTVNAGFNLVPVNPSPGALDALQRVGLKGIVWLGAYDNQTCAFERSDQQIADLLRPTSEGGIGHHPATAAYQLADEPYYGRCPTAPQQIRARSALVHLYDPSIPTEIVVAAYDPYDGEDYPYARFAASATIIGADVYPCHYTSHNPPRTSCDFTMIDRAVAVLDGLRTRSGPVHYWAVIQAFDDGAYDEGFYSLPRPDELQAEFDHWRASRMTGYLVFSWDWPPRDRGGDPAKWLRNHPELTAVLCLQNGARTFGPGACAGAAT